MGNTTTCGDGDDLPPLFSEDVLIEILVWLSVISLLRFKSVCKSWRALIETPFFIDLHTTTTFNSSSSSKFGSFILHVSTKMFMLSSSSRSGSESESESVCGGDDDKDIIDNHQADYLGFPPFIDNHQADYLGFPLFSEDSFMYSKYSMHMVGSCNGLICMYESRTKHKFVYLWNPATRQFRTLPKPITIEEEEEGIGGGVNDFVAFGFDVKTKDYKVVMFRCFRTRDDYFSRIEVYSLSTDSWRLLEGIHYMPAIPKTPFFQNQGIYMNGCYFFVGKDQTKDWLWGGGKTLVCNNSVMYSFDFTKEILTTMQFPDHDSRHDLILSCLGADKIALFMIQRNIIIAGSVPQFRDCGLDNEYYDIWVLNEQPPGSNWVGVVNKESWTKLHSFRKVNKSKHLTQPRCILNNGEFALISTRKSRGELDDLELFSLVTKEAKKDIPVGYNLLRADVYIQSLVSIIGGNGAAAAAAATTTAERVVGGAM